MYGNTNLPRINRKIFNNTSQKNLIESLIKQNYTIMKKIFLITLFSISSIGFAQVAIGKTEVSSRDASLDFGTGNKGIILPWVTSESAVTGAVPGTIIYDLNDKKVKVKLGAAWRDLSRTSGAADASLQTAIIENANAKVVYGKNGATNTTPGILVLSDTDKAMILPKMASPHLNIKNPEAGTMAYDTTTHQLAVFNGSVWTFWKP